MVWYLCTFRGGGESGDISGTLLPALTPQDHRRSASRRLSIRQRWYLKRSGNGSYLRASVVRVFVHSVLVDRDVIRLRND